MHFPGYFRGKGLGPFRAWCMDQPAELFYQACSRRVLRERSQGSSQNLDDKVRYRASLTGIDLALEIRPVVALYLTCR
jgi:hypothetical protein